MITCSKCKETKAEINFSRRTNSPTGRQVWCKLCLVKHRRSWMTPQKELEYRRKQQASESGKETRRRYHQKYYPLNRDKFVARSATGHGLRDGWLDKSPCKVCGSKKSEAHHPDYSRPTFIIWLCRKHHLEQHNKKSHII